MNKLPNKRNLRYFNYMTVINHKLLSKAKLILLTGIGVLFLIISQNAQAQETTRQIKAPKGKVIDQVVAVVGSSDILESDLINQYMSYRMQGNIQGTEEQMKCKILESLLYQKLMLNQAEFDSLTASEGQVSAEVQARLSSVINEFGSQEKMEQYYGKSLAQIKSDLHDMIKDQMLSQQVQQKIIKKL